MIITLRTMQPNALPKSTLVSVTLVLSAIESVTEIGWLGSRKGFGVHMRSGKEWLVAYEEPADTIAAHRELLLKLHEMNNTEKLA